MGEVNKGQIDLSDIKQGLKSPENKPKELNFEDLIFIYQESLGVRHVSSKKQALKERTKGIYGDALAIASFYKLLQTEDSTHASLTPFAIRALDSHSKEQLLQGFASAIKRFFIESIGQDINTNPKIQTESTPSKILNALSETGPSFIIGRFNGSQNSYDKLSYYGLGKCGKKRVPPEKIKAIFNLSSEDTKSLAEQLSTEKMNQSVFDAITTHLGNLLFEKFIAEIKEIKKDFESQTSQ